MKRILVTLWLLPRNSAILLIKGYRKFISPLYGDVCKYYPTCSHYGLQVVQHYGLVIGSFKTIFRIGRCHPWAKGGFDEVKDRLNPLFELNKFGFVVGRG